MEHTFETWYAAVDGLVRKELGLGVEDLGDAAHMEAFEDGTSPEMWKAELIDTLLYECNEE